MTVGVGSSVFGFQRFSWCRRARAGKPKAEDLTPTGPAAIAPLVVLFLAIVLAACRTTLRGTAIDPLKAQSPEAAMAELRGRLESFRGARSLMRVRATSGGKTQSFRAQLAVPSKDDMDLIVYTPVGTTAATIQARGEAVTSDAPADVSQAVTSWLSLSGSKPAEMAMLVLGLPAAPAAVYEASIAGLARASVHDAVVTFEPPQFPPKRVVIRRGGDVVEIEHQEIVATP